MSWFAGLWLGAETVIRVPYFKTMAIGWKILSMFGTAFVYKTIFTAANSYYYGPVMSAYFRKYRDLAKADRF